MNDQAIEQEIQTKGLTAPRVTPDDVEANIAAEFYFTATDGVNGAATRNGGYVEPYCIRHEDDAAEPTLSRLTICVILLQNGFTVTGESACASPENFDAELGRKIARQNAVAKIWPLMGYALRERLYREERGDINQHAEEQLRWHGQLRNDLMDVLGEKDPANILGVVRAMKYRLDSLSA